MATEVILPKVDQDMVQGTVAQWRKREGDWVEKGEVLFVLEAEKVTLEVEARASGFLSKVTAKNGDTVPVGSVIALIAAEGERTPEGSGGESSGEPAEALMATAKTDTEAESTGEPSSTRVSTMARRISREHNIDVSKVVGTGPGGRVTREDVLGYIERTRTAGPGRPMAPVAADEEVEALSPMREVIARRMTESFRTPHFYLSVDVDVEALQRTREELLPFVEQQIGVRITITDLLIAMAGRALAQNPAMNCSYADGSVRRLKRIDIGLVTSIEGGLVAPVIRAADTKPIAEIAKARAELVQKARDRTLTKEEMAGSTFTISNLGMYDVDQFIAVIQPPEAAILAVGRATDKVVVRNGQVTVRPMMNLTLSCDHRVLDGTVGAKFLKDLRQQIENPGGAWWWMKQVC